MMCSIHILYNSIKVKNAYVNYKIISEDLLSGNCGSAWIFEFLDSDPETGVKLNK
jgi:hypothetical protein